MRKSFYIENSKVVNVEVKRISADSSKCITTVITDSGKITKKPFNRVFCFEENERGIV